MEHPHRFLRDERETIEARQERHRRIMADLDRVLPFVTPPRAEPAAEPRTPFLAPPRPAANEVRWDEPPAKPAAAAPRWDDATPSRRDWAEALDLVQQAAETVRASEARLADVACRAQEDLNAAKSRIVVAETRADEAELRVRELETRLREADLRAREAEARAAEAELRLRGAQAHAAEAEDWLTRVHETILTEFAPRRSAVAA